jgi:hypothetical protein
MPQVIALCVAPFLLDRPDVTSLFPVDAVERARKLLAAFKGGLGAYTDSRGNAVVHGRFGALGDLGLWMDADGARAVWGAGWFGAVDGC